jgi:hypothetical protein
MCWHRLPELPNLCADSGQWIAASGNTDRRDSALDRTGWASAQICADRGRLCHARTAAHRGGCARGRGALDGSRGGEHDVPVHGSERGFRGAGEPRLRLPWIGAGHAGAAGPGSGGNWSWSPLGPPEHAPGAGRSAGLISLALVQGQLHLSGQGFSLGVPRNGRSGRPRGGDTTRRHADVLREPARIRRRRHGKPLLRGSRQPGVICRHPATARETCWI